MKDFILAVNYGSERPRITKHRYAGEAQHAFLLAYDRPNARFGVLFSRDVSRKILAFDKSVVVREPLDKPAKQADAIHCWRCGRLCDWLGDEFGCDDCDEPARCSYWGA